jgi:TetR/AcrR family transcriptional regulator
MSSRPKTATPVRPAGRPPGTTGEDTRSEILDAALKAFAVAGFEAMSVRELTRRLGMSHNLVHHHFGSKQDLWRAAIDHGVGAAADELTELLSQAIGSPRSRQVLHQVLESAIALLTKRPEVARIFADESARLGPRLDYLYEKFLGPMVAILSRFLSESRVYGVRNVDSRIAALFVLSSASAEFTHNALAERLGIGHGSHNEYSGSIVDLLLGGLMTSDPDRGSTPS